MKNVVITILAVLVLSLGGYLVYDKVIDKKEEKKCETETTNAVENNDKTDVVDNGKSVISYSDVAGNYEYEAIFDYVDWKSTATLVFELNENGTFFFRNFGMGILGNYVISNNLIILNYIFEAGNGYAIKPTDGKETLKIISKDSFEKGVLTVGGSTFNNVTFVKVNSSTSNMFKDAIDNWIITNNSKY